MPKDCNLPYTKFAQPYAATSEAYFSERMSELVLSLLPTYNSNPRSMADLACGVGDACIFFKRQGFQVRGVDISSSMLDVAKLKAAKLGYAIDFAQQDMREFSCPTKVGLVTCMYDSLNFMPGPEERLAVFKKVFDSLDNKGLFIFDIYTIFGLSSAWGNQVEIHTNTPDHFVTTKTNWNPETYVGAKHFYGFSRNIAGVWERWEEEHTISAFPLDEMVHALRKAGFGRVDLYGIDNFRLSEVSDSIGRALVVAQAER
jgi:SAM-dependent methyltransferase